MAKPWNEMTYRALQAAARGEEIRGWVYTFPVILLVLVTGVSFAISSWRFALALASLCLLAAWRRHRARWR
ncbi:MAG TPA: hypothetical protein VGA40_04320 [Candidatus Acidoferrales bacterium]